jgi:metallo-beta-lactamase class B
MKSCGIGFLAAIALTATSAGLGALGQAGASSAAAHIAAAKAAAGRDHQALFDALCPPPATTPQRAAPPRVTPGPPSRDDWHAEPVRVFDNLYFVGEKEYSAWAVTTSDGIIVIDTIFAYSVEDEIEGGLKKLGLDPTTIKYAVVSHGHADHSGGARYLQEHFGTRVLMSAADWDLLEGAPQGPKPTRDLVISDGQKLTLGDTTLTFYSTPGHTPGTISTLIPVKDRGVPHLAAEWGGTGFNFTTSAEKPRRYWFETYISSAERFRDIVDKAGADVLIANHTNFDRSKTKLSAVLKRKAGEANPYVIGTERVKRYLTVADECAKAGLAQLQD